MTDSVGAPGRVEGVADTAFLVAAFRAQETEREDALFRDPLAARLVGERGPALLASVAHLGATASWSSVVRTALIDRLLAEAIDRSVRTVVNLGAGLDTRPYRLELSASLTWIEADQPAVVAHKDAVLAGEVARCRLTRVGLDLADAAARREMLARAVDAGAPVLVLAEGVFPYLTEDDVAAVLEDLRAHPGIEALIVDFIAPEIVRARAAANANRMHDIPLRFAPADWHGFFAAHGWKVKDMRDLAAEGELRGRPFVVPDAVREAMRAQFQGAPPPKPGATFAAYAVLERA